MRANNFMLLLFLPLLSSLQRVVADTGQDSARKLWTVKPHQWTLGQFYVCCGSVSLSSNSGTTKISSQALKRNLRRGVALWSCHGSLLMSSSVVGLRFKNPCDTILEIVSHLVVLLGQISHMLPSSQSLCLPSSPSLLFVFVQQG